MASKTLSITEDVYRMLKRSKSGGESFSDTIRRLIATRGRLAECGGLWNDMDEKEADAIDSAIRRSRKDTIRSTARKVGA